MYIQTLLCSYSYWRLILIITLKCARFVKKKLLLGSYNGIDSHNRFYLRSTTIGRKIRPNLSEPRPHCRSRGERVEKRVSISPPNSSRGASSLQIGHEVAHTLILRGLATQLPRNDVLVMWKLEGPLLRSSQRVRRVTTLLLRDNISFL